jgi:plasmid stability protein
MQRTQIYLSEEQRRRLARRAADAGTSQAETIRRILDRALGINRGPDERLDAVDATAGVLSDHPDWPEWLRAVRGRGTSKRLRELGL